VILASYHGIPKPYADKGDPYGEQCLETTRLLREKLGLDDRRLISTFQSRFGAQEWLQGMAVIEALTRRELLGWA